MTIEESRESIKGRTNQEYYNGISEKDKFKVL